MVISAAASGECLGNDRLPSGEPHRGAAYSFLPLSIAKQLPARDFIVERNKICAFDWPICSLTESQIGFRVNSRRTPSVWFTFCLSCVRRLIHYLVYSPRCNCDLLCGNQFNVHFVTVVVVLVLVIADAGP